MARTKRPVDAANSSGNYVTGKTRGGNKLRIYSDEAGGEYPIHGAYYYEAEDRWVQAAWTEDGYCQGKETPRSLDINVKSLKF